MLCKTPRREKNIVLLSTGLCMVQYTVRQDMPTDAIVSRPFMKIPTITSMIEINAFSKGEISNLVVGIWLKQWPRDS